MQDWGDTGGCPTDTSTDDVSGCTKSYIETLLEKPHFDKLEMHTDKGMH